MSDVLIFPFRMNHYHRKMLILMRKCQILNMTNNNREPKTEFFKSLKIQHSNNVVFQNVETFIKNCTHSQIYSKRIKIIHLLLIYVHYKGYILHKLYMNKSSYIIIVVNFIPCCFLKCNLFQMQTMG